MIAAPKQKKKYRGANKVSREYFAHGRLLNYREQKEWKEFIGRAMKGLPFGRKFTLDDV